MWTCCPGRAGARPYHAQILSSKHQSFGKQDAVLTRVEWQLKRIAPQLSQIRRHIHERPELSGQEFATTAYLSKRLAAARIPHRVGPGKRGVISDIVTSSAAGAPVVAVRADIDALPIQEDNKVRYSSKKSGVMHACGHDAHTAILLGMTLALYRARPLPIGWRSIFQPSEETGRGAREMVTHGALEGIDAVIALHVDPNLTVGQAGVTAGPRSAFCQDFTIAVGGRGGHGARPHTTVDPIATAANLITLLYQVIPRQTDARDPIVVTIGVITGGHAPNVIPDTVSLRGTIRSMSSSVATRARETVERLCTGVGQAFGATVSPTFESLLPGMVNDSRIAALVASVARRLLGPDNIMTDQPPSMGSEDFADYLPVVPGCMLTLGVNTAGREPTPLHTSTFDIDEHALLIGARLLATTLLEWPKNPPLARKNHAEAEAKSSLRTRRLLKGS
jgi:amidohydrolase